MIPTSPFNIKIMDVEQYIRTHNSQPVTSFAIKEPSEVHFHHQGLFSEEIFGQFGTSERLIRFGYIDLRSKIIQPAIFANLLKMDSLFTEVMAGRTYARFDENTGILTASDDDDIDAETGYSFFLSILPKLTYRSTGSPARNDRIAVINKYRDVSTCGQLLVLPAGVRDIKQDSTMMLSQEDINTIYRSVMSFALQLPRDTDSPVFDSFRFSLQKKVQEVYDYIENIMTGKKGFLQGSYSNRRVVGSTRNVISAQQYATKSPDDPQTLHNDETMVGLYQSMKSNQIAVVYYLTKHFFNHIFPEDSDLIALTDPKTLELGYHKVRRKELNRFTTTAAMDNWINRFENVEVRQLPITVETDDGPCYAVMIYDDYNHVYMFRSLSEIKKIVGEENFDMNKVRPLTWVELFYMATFLAYIGKYAFITRYPAIGDGSTYPSKVVVTTTSPARIVHVHNVFNDETSMFPFYPILGQVFHDTMSVHSSRLNGLVGDYDGDMCSFNVIVAEDANEQIREYMNKALSAVNSQGELLAGPNTDNFEWVILNLMKTPGKTIHDK